MTIDEAKIKIEELACYARTKGWDDEYTEAVNMAIKALEQEPCEDSISRQAVLEAIDAHKYSDSFCKEHNIDWSINLGMVHILVKKLPPVTPQPKMGRWALKKDTNGRTYGVCSECGRIQYAGHLNYCPNCGCKMREVEE